ncbi:MAG: class I SAM-dependent methyltransferase [Patescibacteria group bacterium]|jgi:hypothetical protein
MKQINKKILWDFKFAKAWKKFTPPSRPSQKELKFYEYYIQKTLKKNKNIRILILGATPEFRDLILKHHSIPICCDLNSMVFNALKKLMKQHGKEIFIKSNWLKLKSKNKFDLIIGHQVFNQLPFNKQSLLTKIVFHNLEPNGLFIHSTFLSPPNNIKINPLDGFKLHRKLTKTKKQIPLYSIVHAYLTLSCIHPKNKFFTPNRYLKLVDKLYRQKLISEQERKNIFKILPPGNSKIYVPTKEKLERILKQYFKISSIYYPPSQYYNPINWPVYVLKK